MKSLARAPVLLLAIYSAALIGVELRTSQDHVRHYFTDIEGPVALYGINTTVSTFLLWSCALLFSIRLLMLEAGSGRSRQKAFCGSQILIFAYLGFDDRFVVHERLSGWLGVHDVWILAGIAALEAACLLLMGELGRRSRAALSYLVLAAIAFLAMAAIDALVPSELSLRLSFEDLCKVWAAFFLFLFAWETLKERLAELVRSGRPEAA